MTLGLAAPSGAGADTEVLSFPAEADTYVDESAPATSFGESSGFWVDASPRRHAFLRFWALGLAGRQVTGARLHLTQRDASRSGGRISAMSANDWTESATWNTRPSLGSGPVGSFGSVSSDLSYSAALGTGSVREGVVSIVATEQQGGGVEVPGQRQVGAADRLADALGVGDDRLPLGDELFHERADADLVVGVGALQRRDLAAHQGFELAGAGERPLHAVADGRDLPADGLRHGQDGVRGDRFGLREADRHLAYRPRHLAQLARPNGEHGGDEEQKDRREQDGAN